MITILQRFTTHYFPVYCIALYSFFGQLHYKRELFNDNSTLQTPGFVGTHSLFEIRAKETKILLDLTYKNILPTHTIETQPPTYLIDLEGKIAGHRPAHGENFSSSTTNTTVNLNKKLIHTTLLGSIKLIKL